MCNFVMVNSLQYPSKDKKRVRDPDGAHEEALPRFGPLD